MKKHIEDAIESGIEQILEDIDAGYIPDTVSSFSELHEYVDANEYLEPAQLGSWEEHLDDCNVVSERLDAWLRERHANTQEATK